MKKSFLFLLMIVSVTIVAQAQMVGTNAKSDRAVLSADNSTPKMVPTVHNVLSADFGYGFFDARYLLGCSYYYLKDWGFQTGAHCYDFDYDAEVYLSVGANKRLLDNCYIYANVEFGFDYDGGLDIGILSVRNGIALNAGIQLLDYGDDICINIGIGFDFNRLFSGK